MKKRRKVKELDTYLKSLIHEAIMQLKELKKPSNIIGTQKLYYTGQWAKDVYDNFTDLQAAKIFSKMDEMKKYLSFTQKKISSFTDEEGKVWSGYEYNATKIQEYKKI